MPGGRTSSCDGHSGAVWSAAYQPSGVEPDTYDVAFSRIT